MKLEIELSARSTKRILFVATTIAALSAASVAFAVVPTIFAENDVLTAGALNGNFEALDKRITGLETGKPIVKLGPLSYSLGATYVGPSATIAGKIELDGATGYPAAKKICEAIGAKSPSAHMCDNAELIRSAQLGLKPPVGWYSTGTNAPDTDNTAVTISDCNGWTALVNPSLPSEIVEGGLWANGPSADACATPHPILCCD